ncbi:MAG: hypothetical protein SNJ77_01300 [Cytophagales bacterium]
MKKQLIILIGVVSFVFSCKRTLSDKELLGKELKIASPSFKLISEGYSPASIIGPNGADIRVNPFILNAKFSEVVNWELKLKSQENGAERVFTGVSDTINSSMVRWKGGSTNFFIFEEGQKVNLELRVLGIDTPIIKKTILPNRIINWHTRSYDNNRIIYELIADFEVGENVFGTPYVDVLDGGVFRSRFDSPLKQIRRRSSLYLYSNDAKNPNTYCGGFDTREEEQLLGKVRFTNPDSVFINLHIYGTGKRSTSLLVLLNEKDQQTGSFNVDAGNDKYQYRIAVDWNGWRQISIPYSSFVKAQNGGGRGNNTLNPNRLSYMSFSLDSYPLAGQEVELFMDYLSISQGIPLDKTIIDRF